MRLTKVDVSRTDRTGRRNHYDTLPFPYGRVNEGMGRGNGGVPVERLREWYE